MTFAQKADNTCAFWAFLSFKGDIPGFPGVPVESIRLWGSVRKHYFPAGCSRSKVLITKPSYEWDNTYQDHPAAFTGIVKPANGNG